jgi:hypothetical protein
MKITNLISQLMHIPDIMFDVHKVAARLGDASNVLISLKDNVLRFADFGEF